MGRRKKFGEESGFVNVRVPKSKVSEYREAIKKLVDDKFTRDASETNNEVDIKGDAEKGENKFRDFTDFGKNKGKKDSTTTREADDFFAGIFKEVDKRFRDKTDDE